MPFPPPVPPAVQRRMPSIIRPHQSNADASALLSSLGPTPVFHLIRIIPTPVSVDAARRPSSSLFLGGFGKGASTSSNKKRFRLSLSS